MSGPPDESESSPLLEGVLLEEGTSQDDGTSGGLELDAQQAAEIRQIFLTTLPDYLQPIKEMVARLAGETDDDGKIRGSLAKTIASIGEAAARVKIDDVTRTMETLREDVILIGDPSEPQEPLRAKIEAALASLEQLVGKTSAGAPQDRGETLLSALRGAPGIDASIIQDLVSAGVVYVDQLLGADPKDVAMVSGLDSATVAKIFRALEPKKASAKSAGFPVIASEPPAAPAASHDLGDRNNILDLLDSKASRPPPKPITPGGSRARANEPRPPRRDSPPPNPRARGGEDPSASPVRTLVHNELALEEARGEATRLRVIIEALRTEARALEQQCATLRGSLADAKQEAALRVAALGRADARRINLDRERAEVDADLEKIAARLTALQADRRATEGELRGLADDTAGLADHVTSVVDGHSR
jgi:hypothetical protein